MKITILVDDAKSWFVPYANVLKNRLSSEHEVSFIHEQSDAEAGDVCFLLSCVKIVEKAFLEKFKHNIVVHASDLPKGKGFSPLSWQILEGKDEIVLTLFEAVEALDAGPYYYKETLCFQGTELLDELRQKMALKIIDMCIRFVDNMDVVQGEEQQGEESFYKRITRDDNMLDIDKTIRQQFNHLRIADNERYPLWFAYKGKKYYLKIYNADEER